MASKYYFISGIPRSGMNLLSAILSQNSNFIISTQSSLGELWKTIVRKFNIKGEFQGQVTDFQRLSILRGIVENFFGSLEKGEKSLKNTVFFDTSIEWQKWIELLVQLWPETKIICCARNLGDIANSIERLYNSPLSWPKTYFWEDISRIGSLTTLSGRMNRLIRSKCMVGDALYSLNSALVSDVSNHILVVDYDILVSKPSQTIRCVYKWLQESYFEGHNFSNLNFDNKGHNERLGLKEFYSIFNQVQPLFPHRILSETTYNSINKYNVLWRKTEDKDLQEATKATFIIYKNKDHLEPSKPKKTKVPVSTLFPGIEIGNIKDKQTGEIQPVNDANCIQQ